MDAVTALRGKVDLPICYLGVEQFWSGFGLVGTGPGGFPTRVSVPEFGFEVVSKGEEASNFPMALRETNCIQSRRQVWYLSDSVST